MAEHIDPIREDHILRALTDHGRVAVNDLADALGVSTVTVRKDLDWLESRTLLRRVRGGAIAVRHGEEGAFMDRLRAESQIKRALARNVASHVNDGDTIAIDSSTTSYYLVQELLNREDLVVVTFGMRAAMLFMDQSEATVVLPGGVLRRASGALVGALSDVLADRGRIDKGFFGLAALSSRLGMLELSLEEAATKASLVAICDEVHVSFSASKIRSFGLHSYARADQVTHMYTDDRADDDFVAEWESLGADVTRVSLPTDLVASDPLSAAHPLGKA